MLTRFGTAASGIQPPVSSHARARDRGASAPAPGAAVQAALNRRQAGTNRQAAPVADVQAHLQRTAAARDAMDTLVSCVRSASTVDSA